MSNHAMHVPTCICCSISSKAAVRRLISALHVMVSSLQRCSQRACTTARARSCSCLEMVLPCRWRSWASAALARAWASCSAACCS